jgi:hypothetical protein
VHLTLRRKITLALLALLFCFTLAIVLTRERYHERTLTATFLGFTNTAPGQVKAIIRFPAVHKRAPSPTFFYKPTYDLKLSFKYIHEDGREMTLDFDDRLHLSDAFPLGAADVFIPVHPGTVTMEFAKAEGLLGYRMDNELFGWRPPPPKPRRWKFEMEKISTTTNRSAAP